MAASLRSTRSVGKAALPNAWQADFLIGYLPRANKPDAGLRQLL
jgi:hypothetical protein